MRQCHRLIESWKRFQTPGGEPTIKSSETQLRNRNRREGDLEQQDFTYMDPYDRVERFTRIYLCYFVVLVSPNA